MKNEIRGFIFLVLSVLCYCTHQICENIWCVAAHSSNPPSIMQGGIVLFVFSVIFFIIAVFLFIRAVKENH